MVTLGEQIMIGMDCASSITRNVLFLDMRLMIWVGSLCKIY